MRKLITLFSTISLLSSSVSTIVACGVEDGKEIKIDFGNEPSKQTSGTDPLKDYVYNTFYKYETGALYKPLNAFMQLGADKIRIDRNVLEVAPAAKDFYNSDTYKSGNYESINYDSAKKIERPFSYQDKNNVPLIFGLTDNDISKQQFFGYWYITYQTAAAAEKLAPKDKTSITSPKIIDFKDDKKKIITEKGWIHLFFKVKDSKMNKTFKIDFNIQIDVNFQLYSDKNKKEVVVIDQSTINKPLGNVDFRHPESAIHERIDNMTFLEI